MSHLKIKMAKKKLKLIGKLQLKNSQQTQVNKTKTGLFFKKLSIIFPCKKLDRPIGL